MLRTDGYGTHHGDLYEKTLGDGHGLGHGFGTYDGDGYNCADLHGDGYGNGWGSGRGDGPGANSGCLYNEDPDITVLVINDDPLTTAYQAVTMQTR